MRYSKASNNCEHANQKFHPHRKL